MTRRAGGELGARREGARREAARREAARREGARRVHFEITPRSPRDTSADTFVRILGSASPPRDAR